MRARWPACLVVAALGLSVAPAASADVVPEQVPDRLAVLSQPVARGEVVRSRTADHLPSFKRVDGRVGDWLGEPSRIGGSTRFDAGEHVHSDYLYDAFGADDGQDADRFETTGGAAAMEDRLSRFEALSQAAGDQFDAPPPVGSTDHYGDTDARGVADLSELRWAAQGSDLLLLARTSVLTDAGALGVLVLADTGGAAHEPTEVGFGSGLSTSKADVAVLLTSAGATSRDLATGAETALATPVKVRADGWTNALEAALPANLLAPRGVLRTSVFTGTLGGEGTLAFTPANTAYRSGEPTFANIYSDRGQALALYAGDADRFGATVPLSALRGGRTDTIQPGPGYHERTFASGKNIAVEAPESALLQRYGFFVPTSHDPATASPITYWLHYRGGKAHSGVSWTPRVINELGEQHGNIVVSPHGRGTSQWYVSDSHQDFFEVMADVESLFTVDPTRRYLSGYSMGGYGTWLFGLLYPDLFAGGFPQSGALTQGAWTGEGPDDCRSGQCYIEANGGDASAQLTYRLIENARHFPVAIDHGTDDELVPVTGVQRMAVRMRELGYRYQMTTFLGYEHFSQAIVDEWADGAAYLARQQLPTNPRRVTYKVVPALVEALNTIQSDGVAFAFDPDGAWWVDGIEARDGDPSDPAVYALVDATARGLEGTKPSLLVPTGGAASPPGHSTPYVRHGQDWLLPTAEETSNGFDADLTNVASVTLDAARMGLDFGTKVTATVTTDGAGTLVLTGIARRVTVKVDGQTVTGAHADGAITLQLTAGTHALSITPKR